MKNLKRSVLASIIDGDEVVNGCVAGCVQMFCHPLRGSGVIVAEQAVKDADVFIAAAEQALRTAFAGQNTDTLVLIVHFQERFGDKTVRVGCKDDLVQITRFGAGEDRVGMLGLRK